MESIKKIRIAVLLGVLVILITGYTSYLTSSTVMLAEMFHSFADTAGLGLLLFALSSATRGQSDLGWLGRASGYLLLCAGIFSLSFGLWHLSVLESGELLPVKKPFQLLIASSITVLVVWLQLKLTGDLHQLLHSHGSARRGASNFFGSGVLSSKRFVVHAHSAARTELIADLMQATAGVAMGLIALFIDNTYSIRYVDIFLSVSIGLWMLIRGGKILTD